MIDIIDKTPDLTFLTDDHPEANGRIPIAGENCYALHFTLENGSHLCVKMGEKGYQTFTNFIRQMAIDDQVDAILGADEADKP